MKYKTPEEICSCCKREYYPSSTPCNVCNLKASGGEKELSKLENGLNHKHDMIQAFSQNEV